MSEETAREVAEHEIGRTEDRRKEPERRTNRATEGRRRNSLGNSRRKGPKPAASSLPEASQERTPLNPSSADQRRFNRM